MRPYEALARNPKTPEGWLWALAKGPFGEEVGRNPKMPKGLLLHLREVEGPQHFRSYLERVMLEILHPLLGEEELGEDLAEIGRRGRDKVYAYPNLPQDLLGEALRRPKERPYFPAILANPNLPLKEALAIAKEAEAPLKPQLLGWIFHRKDAECLSLEDLKAWGLWGFRPPLMLYAFPLRAPYTPLPVRREILSVLLKALHPGKLKEALYAFPLRETREALKALPLEETWDLLWDLLLPMGELARRVSQGEIEGKVLLYRLTEDPLGEEGRRALLRGPKEARLLLLADPGLDLETLLFLLEDPEEEVRGWAETHPALGGVGLG